MADERERLVGYVQAGSLMQVSTLDTDGRPRVCSVWYDAHFDPDVLRFISRPDRAHSHNIRRDPRVAGAIVAIPLEGLGQIVQGITFNGRARELPTTDIEAEATAFIARWPRSRAAIDLALFASGGARARIYQITVDEWVLFDEEAFPDQPRRVIAASTYREIV